MNKIRHMENSNTFQEREKKKNEFTHKILYTRTTSDLRCLKKMEQGVLHFMQEL